MSNLWSVRCGTVPYEAAREAQGLLRVARLSGVIPDVILALEHPPVLTLGRRSDPSEIPMGADWYRMQGIEVQETDRGGRVTYHGPGQLVAYPIVDLREPLGDASAQWGPDVAMRVDVVAYVRRLEQVIIESLGVHGVGAGTVEGLTGVWTAASEAPAENATAQSVASAVLEGELRKIASIGVHVQKGVTTHGLAVNVCNDLQPFEWVVPCGIEGCRMTSLSRELAETVNVAAFASTLLERFADVEGRDAVALTPAEVADRVAGTQALAGGAASGALP